MKYKSVFQNVNTQHRCWLCGAPAQEWHHVFNAAFKKKSEQYGAMVRLCHKCHNTTPNRAQNWNGGVHHNKEKRLYLCQTAQERIMDEYNLDVEGFTNIFEKNYL